MIQIMSLPPAQAQWRESSPASAATLFPGVAPA